MYIIEQEAIFVRTSEPHTLKPMILERLKFYKCPNKALESIKNNLDNHRFSSVKGIMNVTNRVLRPWNIGFRQNNKLGCPEGVEAYDLVSYRN